MTLEEYKVSDIKGFPGYKIDNSGNVWTAWRRLSRKSFIGDSWKKKITKALDKGGYKRVYLCKDKKGNVKLLHKLLLEAFIGACPKGMEACHIDGDSTHNCLPSPHPNCGCEGNIEWNTRAKNQTDKIGHGSAAKKLTRRDVISIRQAYKDGIRKIDLARKYNVSHTAIHYVIIKKNWAHVKT